MIAKPTTCAIDWRFRAQWSALDLLHDQEREQPAVHDGDGEKIHHRQVALIIDRNQISQSNPCSELPAGVEDADGPIMFCS